MKNRLLLVLLGSLIAGSSQAGLPKVGYYQSHYSADTTTGCMQVTSNTKQITVDDVKVTYFEFTRDDGTQMVCVPRIFSDTDDKAVDGDGVRTLFISSGSAICTTTDGSTSAPVEFTSTFVFWTGESVSRLKTTEGYKVLAGRKEKQTNYLEFKSTTACP